MSIGLVQRAFLSGTVIGIGLGVLVGVAPAVFGIDLPVNWYGVPLCLSMLVSFLIARGAHRSPATPEKD